MKALTDVMNYKYFPYRAESSYFDQGQTIFFVSID
jgi:hypothetical protein